MTGIKKWLHNTIGRKLFVTVATGLLVILNKKLNLGVPDDVIPWLVGLAASYIFVQAGSDIAGKIRDAKIGEITN